MERTCIMTAAHLVDKVEKGLHSGLNISLWSENTALVNIVGKMVEHDPICVLKK